jgi:hypothetical protein
MNRALAIAIVVLLVAGAAALVGVELHHGAKEYGQRTYVDPCAPQQDPYPGQKGLDATLQRILLGTLNGAACELGVGREELVLSLEPTTGFGNAVHWDDATLNRALKSGLARAIDDANDRNTIPGWVASVLEFVVSKAPLSWILGRLDLPFIED